MTPPASDPSRSSDDRIIEATLTLIARDGLGAVTMRRIAEVAGVSRQTLYNHYRDIDGIVAEAIRRHQRESISMMEASLRVVEHPQDRLQQLIRHVASTGAHAHHAPGIHHGLSAEARATLGEYDEALERYIGEILREGARSGSFRPDLVPDVDAGLIRHMLDGLATMTGHAPERTAALTATATRTILAAVGAPRGSNGPPPRSS